jgi:uncharacterized membrane-anchored protein
MTDAVNKLPGNHPFRKELNDEVHARPSESMAAPMRVSYLVCISDPDLREPDEKAIAALAEIFDAEPPQPGVNHYRADLGSFRVRWERHTEFVRYTFFADGVSADPFADPVINSVPQKWLDLLEGSILVAAHVALIASEEVPNTDDAARQFFAGNRLVGSGVAGGDGAALTDFRIRGEDGFSRLLVINGQMSAAQAGRTVQRLLEIDTYRMMALLALPVARGLAPKLSASEQELLRVTTQLASPEDSDEYELLSRLTQVQADIESRYANNNYRFDAANAYYSLVQRRIKDLRETRIQGVTTMGGFTERRLAPAMETCRTVAVRQHDLSEGVARASQLLSTRVDMARRKQNQAVLASMDRRAAMQLRLQEAVEAISIVALTYYAVGLISYLAYGVKEFGISLNTDLAVAGSIPLVALVVFLVVRRVRKRVAEDLGSE